MGGVYSVSRIVYSVVGAVYSVGRVVHSVGGVHSVEYNQWVELEYT